ncbi:MAG: NAD(P)/FAD-dependent oxidoreductase [Betaproteobacteria bacterium]|nr:NAD(P)/FAD-dependent oxidoreductase [Betaproteobacteria bacterium]
MEKLNGGVTSQPAAAERTAQSAQAHVGQWLDQLNVALHSANQASVASLFAPDGHWRDLFAFTWSITPCQGPDAIAALMVEKQLTVKARGFAIAEGRTPPRRVQRAGVDVIEGIFQYETAIGRGFGVVRLLASDPAKAFQLMTNLHELKGFEEKIGQRRPTGEAYSRNFGGTNWKEQRIASERYDDREPTALVVGGGQAGLTVAATLGHLGVDTLVIDRLPRVGDCWRTRYHSLALHNPTDFNHLPYMPFPPNWPVYLPKDMLADWFEAYAMAMELNFWTSTELVSGNYDDTSGLWSVVVRNTANGSERTVRPKHLIFANGLVGEPSIPDLPGLKDFKGDLMHTGAFSNGAHWRGKKALVLGTGSSGHDIAQDLHANGVEATLIQRGPSMVLSINPSAKLTYAIYDGVPLEDGDLLVTVNTLPVLKRTLKTMTERMVEFDRKLIDGLIARGFKWYDGEDHLGHNMLIRTRYGGYNLDAGCSQLIVNGEVGLLQFEDIERFAPGGALMKDGSLRPADLIVLGTGFQPQLAVVKKLLGETIAKKIGPVWGLGADGEMNNMWKRTPQKGLWFVGGSFSNCRIFSRLVALQIKAIEEGLLEK